MRRCVLALVLAAICWFIPARAAETVPAPDLAKAVASMRKLSPTGLTRQQQAAKSLELNAAWKTLASAGPQGAAALKDELARIAAAKEKDDLFKLGAAAVLWQIGKLDEAQSIADIWAGDLDLSANYNYVFFSACEAAQTQDPRALPMLVAVLKDQRGKAIIAQHSLPVEWPLSHMFIWGAFGSQGAPALERVLAESKDETAVASAVFLLAQMQDVAALDKVRALATQGTDPAHLEAVKALGTYGHPQDFDALVAGLAGADPTEVWAHCYALYEYGDLRAVPQLIALLDTKNQRLGDEVVACLSHLVTPEGIAALQRCEETTTDPQRRAACKEVIDGFLGPVSHAAYAAMTPQQKAQLAAAERDASEMGYRPRPGDRKLTHDDLLKAAAEWKSRHTIRGGTYAWVEDRHVMAAATAADIPLLLDAAAACYARLSDEALSDTSILQTLVQRLGRTRCRREVGVCAKVEPLAQ